MIVIELTDLEHDNTSNMNDAAKKLNIQNHECLPYIFDLATHKIYTPGRFKVILLIICLKIHRNQCINS